MTDQRGEPMPSAEVWVSSYAERERIVARGRCDGDGIFLLPRVPLRSGPASLRTRLYVQAGAGIVADSNPNSEWAETQNKARAVLRAAELDEQGLDTKAD